MAITFIDSNGQLPATKGTLHTMTNPGTIRVTLVNTDTVSRTFNLYVNPTGTSRRIAPKDSTLGAGEKYISDPQTLQAGDLVEGDGSAATIVDYKVNGFEAS